MKRSRITLSIALIAILTLVAFLPFLLLKEISEKNEAEVKGTSEIAPVVVNYKKPTPTPPPPDPIQQAVESMSIEEKVGQMFLGGSNKPDMLEQQIDLIEERHFGGIILFRVNVSTASETEKSLSEIRLTEVSAKFPLFIAIDEEGGSVTRLYDQLSEQTSQIDINSTNQAYQIAYGRGKELKNLGINMNFSPVLDYTTLDSSFMDKRTFHTNKDQIAQLASSMVDGYEDAGIIAVPKHFPGHPDNDVDSHQKLPVVDIQADQLDQYLSQFDQLIEEDTPQAIMIGHIDFPAIDQNYPTTLSSVFLGEILRKRLGYNGVVISDDMNMGAIKERFQFEESIVRAVEAGNDILIVVTLPQYQRVAYETLLASVKNGRISEERIDESVYRIIKMKKESL